MKGKLSDFTPGSILRLEDGSLAVLFSAPKRGLYAVLPGDGPIREIPRETGCEQVGTGWDVLRAEVRRLEALERGETAPAEGRLPELDLALSAEEVERLVLARFADALLEDPDAAEKSLPAAEVTAVVEWGRRIRISAGLLESALNGHLAIAEMQDGEPQFRLTPAGQRYVEEELLPASLRRAKEREHDATAN